MSRLQNVIDNCKILGIAIQKMKETVGKRADERNIRRNIQREHFSKSTVNYCEKNEFFRLKKNKDLKRCLRGTEV